MTNIKLTPAVSTAETRPKGEFDMAHWLSPGGALRPSIVDVSTFHNPKYLETAGHLLYVQKRIYTNCSNLIPAVVIFPSLTDDDVLEDVGVVVRCGCHYGTVMINKQHQSPE